MHPYRDKRRLNFRESREEDPSYAAFLMQVEGLMPQGVTYLICRQMCKPPESAVTSAILDSEHRSYMYMASMLACTEYLSMQIHLEATLNCVPERSPFGSPAQPSEAARDRSWTTQFAS